MNYAQPESNDGSMSQSAFSQDQSYTRMMPRNNFDQGKYHRHTVNSVFAHSIVALPSNPASNTVHTPRRTPYQRPSKIPLPGRPVMPHDWMSQKENNRSEERYEDEEVYNDDHLYETLDSFRRNDELFDQSAATETTVYADIDNAAIPVQQNTTHLEHTPDLSPLIDEQSGQAPVTGKSIGQAYTEDAAVRVQQNNPYLQHTPDLSPIVDEQSGHTPVAGKSIGQAHTENAAVRVQQNTTYLEHTPDLSPPVDEQSGQAPVASKSISQVHIEDAAVQVQQNNPYLQHTPDLSPPVDEQSGQTPVASKSIVHAYVDNPLTRQHSQLQSLRFPLLRAPSPYTTDNADLSRLDEADPLQNLNSRPVIPDSQGETSSTSSLGYPGTQPTVRYDPSRIQTRSGRVVGNTIDSNTLEDGSAPIAVRTRKRAVTNEDISDAGNNGLYMPAGKRTHLEQQGQASPSYHPRQDPPLLARSAALGDIVAALHFDRPILVTRCP